jgi:hypothetical protein
MLMNECDDVELDEMTWAVAEFIRMRFGPLVEIDPISTNEFYVDAKGFVAEVRVSEIVEIVQRFPFDGEVEVSLCDPDSLHLLVKQIGKWMESARDLATRLAGVTSLRVF